MRAATILWGLLPLAILGCKSENKDSEDTVETDTGDQVVDPYADAELSLSLAATSTTAGEAVGYTVLLTDSEGTSTEVSDAALGSDLESELSTDGENVTPFVAGTHTLSAWVNLAGEDWSADAVLEVSPGAAEWVDLTLAATEVTAGDALSFTVTGADAYGNAMSPDDVTLEADSTDITVEPTTVLTTVAGAYTLTASADGQSDSESWTVVPGPAANVSIELDEEELEAGDDTSAEVSVTDEYGNEIEADWTITVSGTGAATVDGDEITFEEEGIYTITVTVDGTTIEDAIALTIDSSGPLVIIDTPNRGSWTTEERVMVSGTVTDAVTSVTSLSIDGTEVTPEADGDFSEWHVLEFGINIIETSAVDADTPEANETTDVRAVLKAADWTTTSDYMSQGLVIRLNEGSGGMDTLSELAADMIDPDTISSLMLGEVASGSCCWGLISYSASVDDVNLGDIEVDVDTYGTALRVRAVINDIVVDGSLGGTFSSGFDMEAENITIQMNLTPSVDSAGNISASIDSTSVTVTGFWFEASGGAGVIEDIAEFFGVEIDERIESELVSAIETEVASVIPDLLEDALSGVMVSETIAVADNDYTILAVPEDIDVDTSGVDITMKSWIAPAWAWEDTWGVSPPGPTQGDFTYPTFAETSGGTELALGVNFLNQLMYAVWSGGLLDLEMSDEDLGVDVSVIGIVLPGLTDLTLVTSPTLPPALIPYEDADAGTDLAIQVGDMYVQIYNGASTSADLYMELYVSAHVPVTLAATSAGDAIGVELGDPDIWVDVISPDPSSPEAAGAEAAFAVLVPALLPELTSALGEIPIPSFSGFGISDIDTRLVGADNGHLMISGNLTAE